MQRVALPASSCTTCAVAEILGKDGVVLLHSSCGAGVAVSHRAVDDVEATLPLVQPHFKIGAAAPWEVLAAVLDVKDAVGSSTANGGKYPKATVYVVQIVPVRQDEVGLAGVGQACVSKRTQRVHELLSTIGVHTHCGKRLIVQRIRERQRYHGRAIVAMIAGVRSAWHNTAAYLSYRVLADTRRRRR